MFRKPNILNVPIKKNERVTARLSEEKVFYQLFQPRFKCITLSLTLIMTY